jgi:hypothetical protein
VTVLDYKRLKGGLEKTTGQAWKDKRLKGRLQKTTRQAREDYKAG